MTAAALQLAKVIGDLNQDWQPHPGQQLVLNALYLYKLPVVQVDCGRKWGKTEVIAYFLWRGAMLFGGEWYYFTPEQKQAREIIWETKRLQNFGPKEWIVSKNESDMRLRLISGGYIKVDGSDNYEAYRGVEPRGAAYDEFKDFKHEFHKAFYPNFSVYNAQLLICGTPPEEPVGHPRVEHYDKLRAQRVENRDLFNFPTWMNPHINRDWLRTERDTLIDRGEWDVWAREYEARRVIGGSNAIFPMFSRQKHVRSHDAVMAEVLRDRKKLIWQVGCDPGTATVFGVLFRAINPYTRRVYVLDEIYEKDALQTSTSRIIPRIQAKREELCPGWAAYGLEWEQVYDEAAAWFAAESIASFDEHWTPTSKASAKKEEGLSLIKDQMLYDLFVVSDRCVNTIKEIEGYIKDKDGKIPKVNDHTVDILRYTNAFASCDLTPTTEPEQQDPDDQRRYYTPEDDMADSSDEFELDF